MGASSARRKKSPRSDTDRELTPLPWKRGVLRECRKRGSQFSSCLSGVAWLQPPKTSCCISVHASFPFSSCLFGGAWLQPAKSSRTFILYLGIYRVWGLRVAPPVLSMWPSKFMFHEENSKHFSLPQQNVFGPGYCSSMQRLVKGTTQLKSCWWLARQFESMWVSYPLQSQFWFYGWGLEKSYITKVGCEKYFCEKYWAPLELLGSCSNVKATTWANCYSWPIRSSHFLLLGLGYHPILWKNTGRNQCWAVLYFYQEPLIWLKKQIRTF